MNVKKRNLVERGFRALGLRKSRFPITPEMYQDALEDMDGMMALWNSANGVRIGYPLPGTPDASDLDDECNIPDVALEAIADNLALRIAPGIGKTPSKEVTDAARTGLSALMGWCASNSIPEIQLTRQTPRGAGNKPWMVGNGVYNRPVDRIQTGADGFLLANDGDGLNT